MATPHIVGLVSLMLAEDSSLTTSKIKTLFRENGKTVSTDAGKSIAQGVEVVKLMNAVSKKEETMVVQEEKKQEEEVQETNSGEEIEFEATYDETLMIQESSQIANISEKNEVFKTEAAQPIRINLFENLEVNSESEILDIVESPLSFSLEPQKPLVLAPKTQIYNTS